MRKEKERLLKIGGLLKRVGNFNPKRFLAFFEERLIFQKTIYLLQAYGLYLGYEFNWYLRGPYSPDLAYDGFALVDLYDKAPLVKFKRDKAERRFLEFIHLFLGKRRRDARWLEQLASIHFLKHLHPSMNKEKIIKKVMAKQPFITLRDCEETWTYLKKFKLI